jgi:hypothetical protein
MAKDTVFQIRMSKEQKASYEVAAKQAGLKLAAWFLQLADDDLKPKVTRALQVKQDRVITAADSVREVQMSELQDPKSFTPKERPFVNRLKSDWQPK